jgi:hypothetical protein
LGITPDVVLDFWFPEDGHENDLGAHSAFWMRRFLLHVLPTGFHRIRHYGLLASAGGKANITRAANFSPCRSPKPNAANPTTPPPHRTGGRHAPAAAAG